jgi:hypothetical protein
MQLGVVLDEYEKTSRLTAEERGVLPLFIDAGHAVHMLLANYDKVTKGNTSAENERWIELGRLGMRQMQEE